MGDGSESVNITVKHLKAFVAVAKTGSFAEASGLIHLSQPAISITIKNLEDIVGGRLLARSTRTLSLTPEGEAFLPVAQRLLQDWDEALSDVHNLFAMRRGKLGIAAMPSFAYSLLPAALAQYRAQYPQVNIVVHDIVAESVVEMVLQGRVEIGVTFDPRDTADLAFTPLFDDEFIAVLPQGHPLATGREVSWPELQAYSFIGLQKPSGLRELLERVLADNDIQLSFEVEAHQLGTIGRMVECGLGISVVPALCRSQMETFGLQCRPIVGPDLHRQVGIVTRHRYPLSSAAEAMHKVLMLNMPPYVRSNHS